MRTLRWAPAVVLAAVLVGGGAAQPPADDFAITPEAGPWVICVASFTGPESPAQARQLAEQLRTRDRLHAYAFNWGDDARRKEQEEYEAKLRELRKDHPGATLPFKHTRHQDYCAVLVGGYADLDAANAALAKVKKLPPPEKFAGDLEYVIQPDEGGKSATQMMANPFSKSFVTRNPALPPAAQERPKFDPIWKDLNAGEEYSLLRNPKPYTLLVKEYFGRSEIGGSKESAISLWKRLMQVGHKDTLTAAGEQAHELARFLSTPQMGYKAYVLHTRRSSLVTVGEFNGPRDPELLRVQQQLAALRFKAGPVAGPGGPAAGSDPIGLMATPAAMEVPRP
jgi:hypothetical protein